MDSDQPRPKRRKSPAASCGIGCMSLILFAMLVFAVIYSSTGSYRVRIPPPAPMPAVNGLWDYVSAGQQLKANGGTKQMYAGPDGVISLAGERAVVYANGSTLATLRSAFGKECRVPQMRSSAAMFPMFGDARDLGRLLSASADVHMADGDPYGAFSDGLDALQMGYDLERGGGIIHALVSIAVQEILRARMVRALDRLTERQCDQLANRLGATLLKTPRFRDIIAEEKWIALSIAQREVNADSFASMQYGSGGDKSFPETTAARIHWHLTHDRTIHEIENYSNTVLTELDKPYPRRKKTPAPTQGMAEMLAPNFEQASRAAAMRDARNRLLLIALAIRVYQSSHRELPSSLADLRLPTTLLEDPFGTGQLIYHSGGGDFVLYSIGPDSKDDGGVPMDDWNNGEAGDVGLIRFSSKSYNSTGHIGYDRVPHMRLPKLPPGAPPLGTYARPVPPAGGMMGESGATGSPPARGPVKVE